MESHSDWIKRAVAEAEKTLTEKDHERIAELTEMFVRIDQLRESHPEVFARLDKLTDEGQFDLAREELEKFERDN